MFGTFDEMFDLNGDGNLDSTEKTIEFMVIDDLIKEDSESEEDED